MGNELETELNARNVTVEQSVTGDFLIDIGIPHSDSKLITADGEIDYINEFFFLRKRSKKFQYFSSLLANFFSLHNASYTNTLFREHHKNISKFTQLMKLDAAGYAVPRTLILAGGRIVEFKTYIESQLQYPFVLKGSGSGGNVVWKINSFDEMIEHIEKSDESRVATVMLQEFILRSNEEFRVVFFGKEIVATVRRSSDDFYNNHAQGGRVDNFELSHKERAVCEEIAHLTDLDYLSIDYMIRDGHPVFIEVQSGPDIEVSKIANPNIISDIADVLEKDYL
jgi:hypothetical protein